MFAYALASNTCSETTNMDDGISMFLTVVSEVKSEFMLERFGDFPKGCDFLRNEILKINIQTMVTISQQFYDNNPDYK